jgi:cytidyltransferase-like protein
MIRIGHAPGAFDLFHIGHLNLLRRAKEHCDFLIAGVVAGEVLIRHKKKSRRLFLYPNALRSFATSGLSTWRMPP